MEEELIIRQFLHTDTSHVQQLINEVLQEYGLSYNPNSPIDEDLTHIEEVYGHNFWVAIDGDKIIGTVAFKEISPKTVKLKRMFVRKDYRGKHVGLKLLIKATEEAKRQGYQEIILNTSPKMTRAHSFYERFGFQKIGESDERLHYKLLIDK